MQLCKIRLQSGETGVGLIRGGAVTLLRSSQSLTLSSILHAEYPADLVRSLIDPDQPDLEMDQVRFLAPLDAQEVWAAGVTYKRSREARERESVGAAQFYDAVYKADRPELFFKATPAAGGWSRRPGADPQGCTLERSRTGGGPGRYRLS